VTSRKGDGGTLGSSCTRGCRAVRRAGAMTSHRATTPGAIITAKTVANLALDWFLAAAALAGMEDRAHVKFLPRGGEAGKGPSRSRRAR